MPVDIRNFFGAAKKETTTAKKKATTTTTATNNAVASEAKTTTTTSGSTAASPKKENTLNAVVATPTTTRPPKRPSSSSSSSAASYHEDESSSPPPLVKKPKASPSTNTTTSPHSTQSMVLDTEAWNRLETNVTPGCLQGITFVFTGVFESISRDQITEFVKICGGRVTTAVSSKTNYVVLGTILEDGRPVQQGKKYLKAIELANKGVQIINNEQELYQFIQQQQSSSAATAASKTNSTVKAAPTASSIPPVAPTKVSVQNPYARKSNTNSTAVPLTNPYATRTSTTPNNKNSHPASNPYAKRMASSDNHDNDRKPAASLNTSKTASSNNKSNESSLLWVDKYKPQHSREILGNQDAVRKLTVWLQTWEDTFLHGGKHKKTSYAAPNGPWKAALLSGPPGIGKTTTATLVAKESGRDVLEFNASDVRSKKAMQEELGDITGSNTLQFGQPSNRKSQKTIIKRCIIMDEVDGMGAGDRSGMAELIAMIKTSRVPIICICNDRQNQKMKSLVSYCMDLRYRRPVKNVIASRAIEIAQKEGLMVERNAAESIAESCGNDVRQVLNCLQMWASSNSNDSMTYKSLKERERSISKDEILRVSLFDAARLIVEGRKGLSSSGTAAGSDAITQRDHFFRRNDAYFVDYNFVGLLVHQNYLKIMQPQFHDVKRSDDGDKMVAFLERMHNATQSMSDFGMVENSLRGDQNWSLLPVTAMLAVKTGYHAGGESGGVLPGFPEFTTWLGRNSTRGKKIRLLSELAHHMNYHISGGSTEMRLSYLPVLRNRLLTLLQASSNDDGVEKAIEFMDEYGLDRDDVFEKLDEFAMDDSPQAPNFQKLDSKAKAAFTRTYNQRSHKSQALVAEQGATKSKTRRQASSISDTKDPDAIDDDHADDDDKHDEDEDDGDEELDEEKIKALFQKKKGRAASKKPPATKKTRKK